MERIAIRKIDGLSGYKLSHLVGELVFEHPTIRRDKNKAVVRFLEDTKKKAVLRALCDYYPNAWPGINEIAKRASCSVAQARRKLRELEYKDRLIVDISRDHPSTYLPKESGETKKGGPGNSPQYFILDRKILNIYQQQKIWKEREKTDSLQAADPLILDAATQSSQKANPLTTEGQPNHPRSQPTHHGELTHSPVIGEPTIEPTNGTHKGEPTNPTHSDGWLALLPKILTEETGSLYTMNKAEAGQIRQLGSAYGTIPMLAALYAFSRRPEGFEGLVWPFTVFAKNIQAWIDKAQEKAEEFTEYVRTANPVRESQFLAELGDAKLGEDVRQLLFDVWAHGQLNQDTLAMLVSEQNQFAAIAEMNQEPAARTV